MVSKKILVALDRSAQTELIFADALELAAKQKAELMIVQVLTWETEDDLGLGTLGGVDLEGEAVGMRRQRMALRLKEAQSWLEGCRLEAENLGITAQVHYQFGEPGKIICQLAQEWSADLIILGRRGHRGLMQIVLGSVSNYVVHHAPCSVLVVQGQSPSSIS